jgi:hypothetical protein
MQSYKSYMVYALGNCSLRTQQASVEQGYHIETLVSLQYL